MYVFLSSIDCNKEKSKKKSKNVVYQLQLIYSRMHSYENSLKHSMHQLEQVVSVEDRVNAKKLIKSKQMFLPAES